MHHTTETLPSWKVTLGLQEGGVIKVPVVSNIPPEINRSYPEIENEKHIVIEVETCNPDRVLDLMVSTEIPCKNDGDLYIIRHVPHPEVRDLRDKHEDKLFEGITEKDLDAIVESMREDGSKILSITKYKAVKQWEKIHRPIHLKGNSSVD